MRNLLTLIFLMLFSLSFLSQDTTTVKYLPLKVGNVWVYNWASTGALATGKLRLKINSTIITNGHIYFVFEQTGSPCSCAQYTHSPFLDSLRPMRIDTIIGGLMFYGSSCQWQVSEKLIDSLKRKVGDNNFNFCNQTICLDTNVMTFFGMQFKTKNMFYPIPTYYKDRRYAYGLGLVSSLLGCSFNTSCSYTLSGCVIDGVVYGDTTFPTAIKQISSEIPGEYSLSQNYPNPFNPATKIRFSIPLLRGVDVPSTRDGRGVLLVVYDILGREIQTLVNEYLSPGTYEVEFEGTNYASGVYYYTFSAGDFFETKKMVLIK